MTTDSNRKKRFIIMFTVTFLYMIAELVVGYWANATTLLTDAYHMLSDVIALVIGFTAIHLSPKKWEKNTFGWARAEVLGALVNAVFLLALCFTIVMDSIQKFVYPGPLQKVELVLIVGGGGLLHNLIGLWVFHDRGDSTDEAEKALNGEERGGSLIHNQNRLTRIIIPTISNSSSVTPIQNMDGYDIEGKAASRSFSSALRGDEPDGIKIDANEETGGKSNMEVQDQPPIKPKHKPKENMNMRSVFLHILADTMNSVVVMIAGGITLLVQKYVGEDYDKDVRWKWVDYLDPGLSVIIVVLICLSTWPLIQETSMILLQNVPSHVSMKVLTEELLAEVKGISGIHEFHVWQLAGDRFYASIHVKCDDLSQYERISKEIKTFFNRRGIHETTIQAEIKSSAKLGIGSDICLITAEEQPKPTLTANQSKLAV